MTSHCTYSAHYKKAPKTVDINNFKKDVCFGWIGRNHKDTEKYSGVIQYMAIQKNVQYGQYSTTFFGREWEISDTDPDMPAVLTREHCEFWIALLQQAGFKFKVLQTEDVGEKKLPAYLFEVDIEEHHGWYGLTLATLTALRYLVEYTNIVRNALELYRKFPNTPPWDLLMAAVRTQDEGGGVMHHGGRSGHSLVFNTDLTYPSCYAECVDAFLLNRVEGRSGWNVQYSFDGKSESGLQYVSVNRIKDIYGGKVHV